MKSNLDFFNLIAEYPEKVLDKYYSHLNNKLVIPLDKDDKNILTESTECLYRYIDTYETLSTDLNDENNVALIEKLLKKIDELLLTVQNINYTSFCQYFMVQNISHSVFTSLGEEDRIPILKELVEAYIKDRHRLYKMYGYTNVVLQTMSDNYSHKRKGKVGITKIEQQLSEVGISCRIKDIDEDDIKEMYYILPDKGDKHLFNNLLTKHKIDFKFRKLKHGKQPDVLLKVWNDYYIIEHKSMKEEGGGQDKQIVEIVDFIRYTENNPRVHYISYLDGIFSNRFLDSSTAKNGIQYQEIKQILRMNPHNYFVNTYAFNELIRCLINNK